MSDDKPSRFAATHAYLAFAIVALFGLNLLLPYFVTVPEGQAGTLIVSGGKVLETIIVLVLGYYFGSTAESRKKTDALAGAVASSTDNKATVTAPLDADITVRDAGPPGEIPPEQRVRL